MYILFSQLLKDSNCDVTSQEGATETLPSTPTRCHRHRTGSSRDSPSFSWFCSAQALLPHSDQILPSLLKPGRDCKKNLSSAGDNKDNKSLLFLISKKKAHFVATHLHLKGKITVTTHLGHVCLAADGRIRHSVPWLFFRCRRALSCPVDSQTKKPS